MLLKELLAGRMLPAKAAEITISGLTADSRQVRDGFLFAALAGSSADGAAFIPDAVRRGAAAILADERSIGEAPVPILKDANPRRALALAAARFYPRQPRSIVAVTGTNGKTSVASFVRQIWTRLGERAASLGTLGAIGPDGKRVDEGPPLTTPDPVVLHRLLDRMAREGIERLAMEASSHGLDQYRLDGVRFRAAAFTNLTQDHLDYHGTREAYLSAKLRLFSAVMEPGGTAVINADAQDARLVVAAAGTGGHRVILVGERGRDVRVLSAERGPRGQRLRADLFGRSYDISLPLAGAFQASNALMAAALAVAEGAEPRAVCEALEHLAGVPGRMEFVGERQGASVFVDYAHTPDAIETVLQALRPHATGRLVIVFGCGGDRDRTKRAPMGAIAARLADEVIVTDDNPRTEDAATIRAAVLAGARGGGAPVKEIADRRAAIASAIEALAPGDVLMIAGKGHESGQIVGDTIHPFDDREIARALMGLKAGGTE